jgi:UDP-N-acetylmuramoylalanine--D-glutamate ligase
VRTPGRLLEALRGQRIHVVGASGAEGVALLLFLAGDEGIEGIVAHDFSADPRAFARSFRRANPAWERDAREDLLRRLRDLPIDLRLGGRYLEGLEDADVVLASQNWFNYPSNLPAIPDAVARGARLLGVVDLAMDLFPGLRIGVTGSNGKSTTSALIRHLLGDGVMQGGNDRAAQVELARLRDASPDQRLVWEVSNRHLRDRPVEVDVAVLTNITANHIEDHGSWDAYVQAKLRLLRSATAHAVITATDPESSRHLDGLAATVWRVGVPAGQGQAGAWVDAGRFVVQRPGGGPVDVGPADALALPGEHNRTNALSALAAAAAAGVEPAGLAARLATFRGLAGRLELVAEAGGVRWIWDIQATTAPAAEAGIRAEGRDHRLVLLVGGDDKGMDYRGMADAAALHADAVLALPGSGTDAFLAALAGRIDVHRHDGLDDALAHARELAPPGASVLCSPGCAFFFSRFVDGGPTFARRVAAVLPP